MTIANRAINLSSDVPSEIYGSRSIQHPNTRLPHPWLETAENVSLFSLVGSSVIASFSQQLLPLLISIPLSLGLGQVNRQRFLQVAKQTEHAALAQIQQSLAELQASAATIQTNFEDEQSADLNTQAILTTLEQSVAKLHHTAEAMYFTLKEAELARPKSSSGLAQMSSLVIHPTQTPAHLHQDAKRGRVAVVIDGCNLDYSAARENVTIDFAKLKECLIKNSTTTNGIYYYTGIHQGNRKEQAALSALRELGYQVIGKNVIQHADGSRKGNLDVEMALDMMALADQSDTIVLVSGDGDLTYAINQLKQCQIRVEVFSFRSSTATKLMKAAHPFYHNLSGLTKVCRPVSPVAQSNLSNYE